MDILSDTIAAVSTPRGTGGIAVIRTSGDESFEISDRVIKLKCGKKIAETTPGKLYMCTVINENGTVDECMCTHFIAPNSYTGENSVEVYCHGGALCTSMVLETLFVAGARQALAGEFTKRAYINGKLSLSAAEAVGELIHAKTKAAVTLSNSNMRGTLDTKLSEISEKLKELLASVYVYIDYPDEELYDVTAPEMCEKLKEIKAEIDKLAKSYRSGMAVSEGINTAIVGTPNTGKSTLLNLLCRKNRAIVTDIAGTTRDIVTEDVVLGDVLLKLSDTAGVRETDDTVEKIGVELSLGAINEASLIFAVFDGSRELSSDDIELAENILSQNKTVIAIINKSDKGTLPKEKIESMFENTLILSAASHESRELIEKKVTELYLGDKLDFGTSPIVTTASRHAALVLASESLEKAISLLSAGDEQTIAGTMCEDAVAYLDESSGRTVSEDIVNSIFSKFCVGK